jgi:signal transduction histidine kinase
MINLPKFPSLGPQREGGAGAGGPAGRAERGHDRDDQPGEPEQDVLPPGVHRDHRRVLRSPREDAAGLAEDALLAVEASGRTAMGELRSLLCLLAPAGGGPDDALLTPQPGLADVSALVERVSAAGLRVELHSSLPPGGLPPGLDLAVYRVVQEGLTNVLRHAGGAPTVVRISGRLEQLVITVSDDGSGTSGAESAWASGHGGAESAWASGHGGAEPGRGLLGLRERVALYGGAVDAGPRPGGGWRLRATMPLPELAGA